MYVSVGGSQLRARQDDSNTDRRTNPLYVRWHVSVTQLFNAATAGHKPGLNAEWEVVLQGGRMWEGDFAIHRDAPSLARPDFAVVPPPPESSGEAHATNPSQTGDVAQS
jgi:hypothetical protein